MLTDGRTDRRRTDAGVTGILIAHLGAFGSGELKMKTKKYKVILSTYLVINLKTKLCKCSKISNTSCLQKTALTNSADPDQTASGSSLFAILKSIL